MLIRGDRVGSTSQYIILGVRKSAGECTVPALLATNQKLTASKVSRKLGSSAAALENDSTETTHGVTLATRFQCTGAAKEHLSRKKECASGMLLISGNRHG